MTGFGQPQGIAPWPTTVIKNLCWRGGEIFLDCALSNGKFGAVTVEASLFDGDIAVVEGFYVMRCG